MATNISGWLLPLFLVVTCLALAINIFHNKKVTTTMVAEIDTAKADLQAAAQNNQELSKKMEEKNKEVSEKDKQIASLTANVNTLTEEKNKLQEQLNQLTAEKEAANNATSVTEAKPAEGI